MAEPKTKATAASVAAFLGKIKDPVRRADCATLVKLCAAATRARPKMWGPSIVGFGTYRYPYADGSVREWPLAGFSPRKPDLVVYLMPGFANQEAQLARLGPHKTGKSCLYLKRLSDVKLPVLRAMIAASVKATKRRYPG